MWTLVQYSQAASWHVPQEATRGWEDTSGTDIGSPCHTGGLTPPLSPTSPDCLPWVLVVTVMGREESQARREVSHGRLGGECHNEAHT